MLLLALALIFAFSTVTCFTRIVRNLMGIQEITVSTLALFLLLQQPWVVAQSIDFLGPIFAPLVGDVECGVVPCGKGTCKIITNGTFPNYECVCDSGWTQVGPPFMPCVIPNCTLNYSCLKTPGRGNQGHWSPLDACTYADCGGGMCNNTVLPYKCDCDEGYGNLLNATIFTCVKDCALGFDCNHLQIPLQNNTMKPNNTDNSGSLEVSSGNLILLLILGISMSIIVPSRHVLE